MYFWIGLVREVQEDNSVKFDIEGLDNFSIKPIAYPAESVVRRPEKGDRVIIEQPDAFVQTFLYRTLGDKNIWLKNGDSMIDISDEDNCVLTFPNFSIEASKSNVTVNIGKVKITADSSGATISGAGASLKVNGVVAGDAKGGPFLNEAGNKALMALANAPVSGSTITLL